MRTTVRVKIHLSKELHWAATEAAKQAGLSFSDFLRRTVKKELAGLGSFPRDKEYNQPKGGQQ